MRPGSAHRLFWHGSTAIQFILAIAIFCLLALQLIPAERIRVQWIHQLQNSHSATVDALNAFFLLLITSASIAKTIIQPPWFWSKIQRILSDCQAEVFSEVENQAFRHHHRITLYKYVRWNFWPYYAGKWHIPWGGWLVPLVRAGPDAKATTSFPAHGGSRVHGVCGAAFYRQSGMIELDQLPELTAQSTPDEIREYARKTFVDTEMVQCRLQANKPCARCFLALSIRVNGMMWGVVMIDSMAESLPKPQNSRKLFQTIQRILQRLLETTK